MTKVTVSDTPLRPRRQRAAFTRSPIRLSGEREHRAYMKGYNRAQTTWMKRVSGEHAAVRRSNAPAITRRIGRTLWIKVTV